MTAFFNESGGADGNPPGAIQRRRYRRRVHRRRVTYIVLAAVTTAAIVVSAAVVAWHYVRPRLPAVGAVEANTDAGIAAVVKAAGDQAAVTVTELVATTACQHTMFARGHLYTRTANLYTDAGAEDALISRIAAGLPGTFHASRANPLGAKVAPLNAQAGQGVHLTVQVISAGWISATAQTDCRTSPTASSAATADRAAATAPAAVTTLFTALGTTTGSWHTETVPCPGGTIATVDAISATTDSAGIAARLGTAVPAGARRYTTPSNRLIWRTGNTSTLVAASDDGTHVTAQITTTSC